MGRRDIRWEIKTIGKSKVPVIPRDYKDNNDPQWQIDQCLNCTEEECHPYGECSKIDRRKKKMSDRDEIKELKAEIKRLRKRLEEIDRGCWNCAIGKFMDDIEEKDPKLHSIITENLCTKCTDIFYRDHEFWVKDTQGNRLQETKKALEIHSDRYSERWEEPFKKWEENHDV